MELMTPAKRQLASRKSEELDFHKAFYPGEKSLSIGRLDAVQESYPGSHQGGVVNHKISGWFGTSRAMIAVLDHRTQGAPHVVLLRLFKGGDWRKDYNWMVPFHEEKLSLIAGITKSGLE